MVYSRENILLILLNKVRSVTCSFYTMEAYEKSLYSYYSKCSFPEKNQSFLCYLNLTDRLLFQIRGGAFNPGWQYDANALEFSHQRELNHQRKQRTSFGTYQVFPFVSIVITWPIIQTHFHQNSELSSLMNKILADFFV